MDLKKTFYDLAKWGTDNENNRKTLIRKMSMLIAVLNETRGKKLSDEELKKIAAGSITRLIIH